MRTYGRVYHEDGSYTWVEVDTADDGSNDMVYVTALIQELKLNLNESPFYANRGIPAKDSVIQQVFPDFNVSFTQQQFASRFASIVIAKQNSPTPTYRVNVTTNNGVKISAEIPV